MQKSAMCSSNIALTVRASLEDTAAYLFDYESRANRAFGDSSRTIVERRGDFELLVNRTVVIESKFGSSQHVCDFYSVFTLHVIDADTIVLLLNPAEPEGSRMTRNFFSFRISMMGGIMGRERSAVRLRRVGAMETKIECTIELEFGVYASKTVSKKELEEQLRGYKMMENYFLTSLSEEDFNEKDGMALGLLLHEEGKDTMMKTMSNFTALNAFLVEFPWFPVMLEEVMKNKLRPSSSGSTKAKCVSQAEAKRMGGSLSISLATNITAPGGVDE